MFEDLVVPTGVKSKGDVVMKAYVPFTSGIYNFVVELAYGDKSTGGANSLNLHLREKTSHGKGRVLRTAIYCSNKQGGVTYQDKDGVDQLLPGFELSNDFSRLTCGRTLDKAGAVDKNITLMNWSTRLEETISKKVLECCHGLELTAAVLVKIEDKNVLNAAGKYVPSGETREVTQVEKFYRTRDGLTVNEIIENKTVAEHMAEWLAEYEGKVVNKAKKGTPAAPPTDPGTMFGAVPGAGADLNAAAVNQFG
jgi:hypothetical protein